MRNPWVSARRRGAGRAVAMNQVEYQASFWFPITPPEIWAIIERFDLFESWWAWLADFRADDGGLVTDNVLHGTVIPPIPYRQRALPGTVAQTPRSLIQQPRRAPDWGLPGPRRCRGQPPGSFCQDHHLRGPVRLSAFLRTAEPATPHMNLASFGKIHSTIPNRPWYYGPCWHGPDHDVTSSRRSACRDL